MNILDIGDLALTSLPKEAIRRRTPQLDSSLLASEQLEAGVPVVFVMRRGTSLLYKFTPDEWKLLQLFDGKRSFAEIADEYDGQTGLRYAEDDIRAYAEARLENSTELFYYTPAEKNLARLHSHRHRRKKRGIDLAEIRLWAFDPNEYLTWMYQKLRFIFTPWFTLITLVLWAWMFIEWGMHWSAIWNDSVAYFTFTAKGFSDLAEFWLLFLFVAVVHETAHGLATIHWGGESHQMGFMLMWMSPAFYCDCAEVYIYGGKWERIGVSFAGMWSELLLCVAATAAWLATAPGMYIHELAYKVVLVGGIFLIVMNLNPLIKLDGYFIFTDLIGFPDLKEESTAYTSNLVRKFFGLPHELPNLRLRRKIFFTTYSVLSGIYSYSLLILFAEIGKNISQRFWPEWSFLPTAAITFLLFRSRLVRLVEFMKTVYLDKKERWKAWLRNPLHSVPLGAAALILLFAPMWRDTVQAPFVLEAPERAVVRAAVDGRLITVDVHEGERVAAGQAIGELSNLQLQSESSRAEADYDLASARAVSAQLRYTDLSSTDNDRARAQEQKNLVSQEATRQHIASPISGIVVTPRPENLLGSYVQAGTTIVEVAQTSTLRARLYVPDPYMHEVHLAAPISLLIRGRLPVHATVGAITPAPADMPKEIFDNPKYHGLGTPVFYSALANIANDGTLQVGASGEAKILVARRSIAGFVWKALGDSVRMRVW